MPRQGAAASGRYRMSQEGQASQRGLQGMYILKENAGCQIYRPTWNGTRTVFRPFPGKDPDNPQAWDPFRLSDEDRDFGDWIRRYDMASSFGVPGITFIMKDPLDKTSDDQQNPVWMLHRSITQAVKSGQGDPSWNPLIFGATGRAAPLNAPKDGYVMQGILMEHKSNPQNPPRGCLMEHQPVVLLMSQSAGEALLDKLSEKDANGNWVWPDIVSLDGGMFVQFHQAGTQNQAAQNAAPIQMGANMAVGGGNAPVNNTYEVEIMPTYNGIAPTSDLVREVAAAHVKPWDEIIRIPTIEEQVKMLCSAGIPASAIMYALSDVYSEAIPEHIRDQAMAQSQPNTTPFQSVGNTNPMAQATEPQAPAGGNPMGAAPTATQPDPGMPAVQPPAQQPPPQAQPPAEQPAGNPMGTAPTEPAQAPPQETTAPQPTPEAQGFDPQPTHADTNRAQSTVDALQRARDRAAAAAAQQGG